MNDLDLLHRYSRQGSQEAFSVIVGRHLDLVYSAAKRQVGSPDFACEVAQTVFLDLAGNAEKIAPDTDLASWLFVASRRRAIDLVRREASRQRREQAAVEVSAMKATSEYWPKVEPLIDEAIASLDDKDRTAVLLRFFENKSLEEVGRALGASEDAAQKRVSRAVERLRSHFAKRGIVTAAAALAADLSAYAVQSAPANLSSTILSTLTAKGAVGALLAQQAARTIGITVWTKAMVLVATVAIGLVGYQFYQSRHQQKEIAELEGRLGALRAGADRLKAERDRARARTGSENLPFKSADAEFDARVKMVLARIALIKKRLQQDPRQQIPELSYLSESDWFGVIEEQAKWVTEDEIQEALSSVRTRAKNRFLSLLQQALAKYVTASHGQLPADVAQLASCFASPVDLALLSRYEMIATGLASGLRGDEDVIREKAAMAINPRYDNLGVVFLGSFGVRHVPPQGTVPPELKAVLEAGEAALKSYREAHSGFAPDQNQPEQLLPYFTDAEVGTRYLQIQAAASNPLQFSRPNAMGEAMNLYQSAHHGVAWSSDPEELAPYFQNPNDAAKFIMAVRNGTMSFR